MIYDLRGVPIDKEYWLDVTMAMTQLRARNAARTKRQYMGELDGSRKQIVTEDRLGDPIAIYRDITAHVRKLSPHREQYADMQKVRAAHGVGRPPRTRLYPPSQGAYYGIGPGVAALPLMRRLNRLPPAERAAAAARFVESRLGA